MNVRSTLTAGVLLAAFVAVSGCDSTAGGPTLVGSDSTTASVATTPVALDVPTGDVTPPGTVLRIGESAFIEFRPTVFPANGDDPYASEDAQLIRFAITDETPASYSDLPQDLEGTGIDPSEAAVVFVSWEAQLAAPSVVPMARRRLAIEIDPIGYNSYMYFSADTMPACVQPAGLSEEFDQGAVDRGCFAVIYYATNPVPDIGFGVFLTDTGENPVVWTPSSSGS